MCCLTCLSPHHHHQHHCRNSCIGPFNVSFFFARCQIRLSVENERTLRRNKHFFISSPAFFSRSGLYMTLFCRFFPSTHITSYTHSITVDTLYIRVNTAPGASTRRCCSRCRVIIHKKKVVVYFFSTTGFRVDGKRDFLSFLCFMRSSQVANNNSKIYIIILFCVFIDFTFVRFSSRHKISSFVVVIYYYVGRKGEHGWNKRRNMKHHYSNSTTFLLCRKNPLENYSSLLFFSLSFLAITSIG